MSLLREGLEKLRYDEVGADLKRPSVATNLRPLVLLDDGTVVMEASVPRSA